MLVVLLSRSDDAVFLSEETVTDLLVSFILLVTALEKLVKQNHLRQRNILKSFSEN